MVQSSTYTQLRELGDFWAGKMPGFSPTPERGLLPAHRVCYKGHWHGKIQAVACFRHCHFPNSAVEEHNGIAPWIQLNLCLLHSDTRSSYDSQQTRLPSLRLESKTVTILCHSDKLPITAWWHNLSYSATPTVFYHWSVPASQYFRGTSKFKDGDRWSNGCGSGSSLHQRSKLHHCVSGSLWEQSDGGLQLLDKCLAQANKTQLKI